jgi:hypothetical protein
MRSIRVTINGTQKIKVKVSSRKLKDIKITIPEEFVADTITLFKDPEKLVLTEQNVAFLAGLCETHKRILNLKPIFLKRISDLQSEIDSILKAENGSGSDKIAVDEVPESSVQTPEVAAQSSSLKEESGKTNNFTSSETNINLKPDEQVPVKTSNFTTGETEMVLKHDEVVSLNESDNKVTSNEIFSILENADKLVTQELESFNEKIPDMDISEKSISKITHGDHNGSEEVTTNITDESSPKADDRKLKRLHSSKTIILGGTSATKELTAEDGDCRSTLITRENTKISISESEDNTTIIKAMREREVTVTKTTYERDPNLFVRIVSPKQKVITRYSSYSPEIKLSPVFGDFVGDDKNLVLSVS